MASGSERAAAVQGGAAVAEEALWLGDGVEAGRLDGQEPARPRRMQT